MDLVNPLLDDLNQRFGNMKLSKSTILSIGAAISVTYLYWKIIRIIQPPRKLRHIPHVSFYQHVKSIIERKPYSQISKEFVMPLLTGSKTIGYLKPDALGWTLNITNPEACKDFFLKTDIYPKANIRVGNGTLFQNFIGDGNIAFASGREEWQKHRKLVNPAFHKSMPIKMFTHLTHQVFKVLDEANGKPVNATRVMERFTLNAISMAVGFGFDAINHPDSDWFTTYAGIKVGLAQPIYFVFPWLDQNCLWLLPKRRQIHKLSDRFHSMMDNLIEEKRQLLKQQQPTHDQDEAEKDILTLMLEAELSGEGSLTDAELKSNLNVFFLAGHDTTANALAAAIYHLAKNPTIQQKARAEALSVLGDAPADVFPTLQDTKQLNYINQVIRETLRFHAPAIAGTPRLVTKGTELAGVYLPKGTPVVVNTYDLHHNPRVWTSPDTFDPSRFDKDGEAQNIASMSWVPFYGGQRMCIGMQFSLMEQRIMLSCLLRKYEWQLPDDSKHKENLITGNIGLLVAKDLDVVFKRRY